MSNRTAPRQVVVFETTGAERVVTGRCKTCLGASFGWPEHLQGVVSKTGVEHLTRAETTLCGHDATGDDWWWPI